MNPEQQWTPGQRHLLRRALAPSQECPALADLHAWVEGDAASQFAGQAADHVSQCDACKSEVQLYREFLDAKPSGEEASAVEAIAARRTPAGHGAAEERSRSTSPDEGSAPAGGTLFSIRRPIGWLPWAAASAAVLLAVLIGVERSRSLPDPPAEGSGIYRAAAKLTVEPSGDLERIPASIRWAGADGAASVTVKLVEVDGSVLWSGAVSGSAMKTPESWRKWMRPGKMLHLEVSAMDGNSRVLATGRTSFRVRVKSVPE